MPAKVWLLFYAAGTPAQKHGKHEKNLPKELELMAWDWRDHASITLSTADAVSFNCCTNRGFQLPVLALSCQHLLKCLHAGCHKCCVHRRCSEEIRSGWCTISKQGCPGNQEEFGRDIRALLKLKQDINNAMPSDVMTQTQNAIIMGGNENRTIQCYMMQHKNSPSFLFVDINPEQ